MHFCRGIILFPPLSPVHTELYVSPRVITRFNIGEHVWQCCRFADSKFCCHNYAGFIQFCCVIHPEGTSYFSAEFTFTFSSGSLLVSPQDIHKKKSLFIAVVTWVVKKEEEKD